MKKLLKILLAFTIFTSLFNFNLFSIHATNGDSLASMASQQVGKTGGAFGMSNNWCARFVWKCAEWAGIGANIIPRTDGATTMYNTLLNNGAYTVSSPQRGDLVFYRDTWAGGYCHVGIMVDSINSVQGNVNFKVEYMKYQNYEDTSGNKVPSVFVRPKYNNSPIVTPTIYADKESYTQGDNVALSWQSSSSSSNLSHYWLVIKRPNGSELFGGSTNKNTSYSFSANDIGTYTITVYATPLGSISGEGSLIADKNVTVKSKVINPSKPNLSLNLGNTSQKTVFKWNSTTNTTSYTLNIYYSNNSIYKAIKGLTSTSYSLQVPAGNYYAQLVSYSNTHGTSTSSDKKNFTISKEPAASNDGWIYANSLPYYVNTNNYSIEYKNSYEKIQTGTPGNGWTNAGVAKTQYEDNGAPYWSNKELPTSESRVLLNYNYFHFCGSSTGLYSNYEGGGNFVHYDEIRDPNSVTVFESGSDWENPAYKYYRLKWTNGNLAYCNSSLTCDSQYGTHGNRSCVWYKNSQYQDKKKVTYYKYTKSSNWTSQKDASASSSKVRYKLTAKFADVSKNSWYYTTVIQASDIGLMKGIDNTHFSPNGTMSRGMAATVIYRMAGSPAVTYQKKFSDVPNGKYYSKAITWAVNQGIMNGYKTGKFGTNDNITREQLAVVIRSLAVKEGLNTKSTNTLAAFKDKKNVSNYAKGALAWAVDKKIISGAQNGTKLNPKLHASRAECAKMFLQSYKLINQ